MQRHPTSLHIHLVATACVFNLTTQDLAQAMPISLLSSTVTQLLNTMKNFPNHQQVRSMLSASKAFTQDVACTLLAFGFTTNIRCFRSLKTWRLYWDGNLFSTKVFCINLLVRVCVCVCTPKFQTYDINFSSFCLPYLLPGHSLLSTSNVCFPASMGQS